MEGGPRPTGDIRCPELVAAKQPFARLLSEYPRVGLLRYRTSAASRCMNANGDNTEGVVLPRRGILSLESRAWQARTVQSLRTSLVASHRRPLREYRSAQPLVGLVVTRAAAYRASDRL